MAKQHEGRALADPRRRDTDTFYAELVEHLRLQYPDLKNIRVERATPTGEWDTVTGRQWHKVVFFADS